MKTLITIALLVAATIGTQAQKKVESYDASNGVTYRVGERVQLGRGANDNGNFVYLTMGGIAAGEPVTATYANMELVIKKITKRKFAGNEKVYFTVAGGNIVNYVLDVEAAIVACEVRPCQQSDQVGKQ